MQRVHVTLVASCLAASGPAPAAYAQIHEATGKAGAVDPAATGELRGEPIRSLLIGNEVFASERVRTDASGRTQLLFLDGTRILVVPSSDIILNRVRPSRRPGEVVLAVTLVAGSFWLTSPGAAPGAAGSAGFGKGGSSGGLTYPGITTGAADPNGSGGVISPSGSSPTSRTTGGVGLARPVDGISLEAITSLAISPAPLAANSPTGTPLPPPPPAGQFPQNKEMILLISLSPNGGIIASNLGSSTAVYLTPAGISQPIRQGFALELSATGEAVRIQRISPETYMAIVKSAASPASHPVASAAATSRAGPITAQNSTRSASDLAEPASLAALSLVDPRSLNLLAGIEPGQPGTIRQQASISNTVNTINASPAVSLFYGQLRPFLPATVSVSGPGGTQTATFSSGPGGAIIAVPSTVGIATFNRLGSPSTATISSPALGTKTVPFR